MKDLTHISLFSGIGGIDLAAEWAGFRSILFVENDLYCQKVLKKHWPDVPIIGDIKDVRETGLSTDLITGGFPCQPVSNAGQRRGQEDDRWLWPEMLRIISDIRPTWVVAENVAGLLQMGFNACVSELESKGYQTISFLIPACAVNAPHRRDRIFIVGYTYDTGCQNRTAQYRRKQTQARARLSGISRSGVVAHTQGERLEGPNSAGDSPARGWPDKYDNVSITQSNRAEGWGCQPDQTNGRSWWATEPELGRVAYGITHRVDRLKCLGNAVVPQQIYPILKAIADIENGIL